MALLLAAGAALGQTSLGRITGTVLDPEGASVPGATVVVTNTDTGATRTVKTDGRGIYSATDLAIGTYSIDVSQDGFRRQQRTGIPVVADARITTDFTLQLGNVTEAVDVTAVAGETINTVSGELSHVIETKQVNNLALNGRNYTQLMSLIPGAVVTNPDQFSVTTSLSSTNQTINGNRSDSNNLTVDGAYNQVAGSNGSLMNNVSAEFIQEVKLQTSNFSAEYGRTSGPAFNIVTKNGTNEFHGAAFEYFRNDLLDARNFFAAQKTQLRFNDFGYAVGGPIKKNKLFFFAGEEWKRLRQQQTPTRVTVPSTAQLNGNFNGTGITLFAPGTRTPIPGNNISSLITPDGAAIANVYRSQQAQAALFNDSAVANNLTLNPSNPLNYREDLIRIDYNLNEKNIIYGRWIQDKNDLIDPFGTFSGSALPVIPSARHRPGESFLIAHTWLVSSTMVNEARANASWAAQRIPPATDSWMRSAYGFQYPQLYNGGQYDAGIPQVSITNFAGFVGPTVALQSPSTDIQFSDTFSITRGSHNIKLGVVVIRDRVDQNGRPSYTGNVNFNAAKNPNTTGNALADALLGNFQSYQEASADPVGFFRFTQPEAFLQDSWRVNDRFSLEIGLRYQYMSPMYTQANNMANFVPGLFDPAQAVTVNNAGNIVGTTGNRYNGLIREGDGIPSDQVGRVPGAGGPLFQQIGAGAPRGLSDPSHFVAPRFGFAYRPQQNTSIRGGFGMFYFRPQGNLTFSQVNLPPFLAVSQYSNGNLGNPAGGSPGSSPLGGISAIDPGLQFGSTYQYSLSIQRELPHGFLAEASYVGNLGRHLLRQPNINFPDLLRVAANPGASSNAFVPYLGYSSINQFRSDSTSNYNALQLYASKRQGALFMTLGYTWSKALADASGQGDNLENWQNRHFNYGPTSYDRRHAFVGTFVYQLPALANMNGFVRTVLGGWQGSGVIRLQSGQYYSITGQTAVNTRRADYNGQSLSVDNPGPNRWFNTAAFSTSPNNRFGNSGTGVVEGPGLRSYDLSLAKHFKATERLDFKLQGDFFNVINTANFQTLNTVVTNNNFGTLSAAYPPRQIQLSLRASF